MGIAHDDIEKSLLQPKARNWKAPLIILGFECLESTAFFGVAANLVTYLSSVLHETNSESATNVATWSGTSYLTPLMGAVLADAVLGNYKTSFLSAIIYLVGMLTLTLSASFHPSTLLGSSFPSLAASSVSSSRLLFYAALYMVAFGSGGLKSSLLPLGAQQFDDQDPRDLHRKGAFFGSFYVSVTIGSLIASTVIVWIQENMSWVLGYSIATACIALGLGMFLLGTTSYKIQKPAGSPLKSVAQVAVASLRKLRVKTPADSSLLFEVHAVEKVAVADDDDKSQQKLVHTDGFRFLDKAAVLTDSDIARGESGHSWRLCTVTQVEEVKMLLRLVPIWLTSIVFSVAFAQMSTTFLEQGEAMDNEVGPFSIPAASLPAFEVVCVIGWTMFYDKIIVPVAGRYTGNPRGLSVLQQMGLGRFLMVLAMGATALTEMKRLECARAGTKLSIAWQLPQYFLMGGADGLNYIGQLEFFYDQAPNSMKSMGTAFNLLSISLGNYGSSFLVSIVAMLTTAGGSPGWIPENLNEGHLDYFFWGIAALSTLNLVIHLACSKKYTFRNVAKGISPVKSTEAQETPVPQAQRFLSRTHTRKRGPKHTEGEA